MEVCQCIRYHKKKVNQNQKPSPCNDATKVPSYCMINNISGNLQRCICCKKIFPCQTIAFFAWEINNFHIFIMIKMNHFIQRSTSKTVTCAFSEEWITLLCTLWVVFYSFLTWVAPRRIASFQVTTSTLMKNVICHALDLFVTGTSHWRRLTHQWVLNLVIVTLKDICRWITTLWQFLKIG